MRNKLLFISYCHKDEDDKNELEKWLLPLSHDKKIEVFSDSQVPGGGLLETKLNKALIESRFIILLMTQDYIASPTCQKEMEFALNNLDTKIVFPIILKTCTWKSIINQKIKALPKDGKPIREWSPIDHGWEDIYKEIAYSINLDENVFQINKDFYLNTQHIDFIKQGKDKISLEEIFVFPQLTKVKDAFSKVNIDIDFFQSETNKRILITGPDYSGKSTLLYWLFSTQFTDFYPVLVDGRFIFKTRNFAEFIKEIFNQEYIGDFTTWMKQKNKIILIDNYDHEISANFIKYLCENFYKVIICMDHEEYMVYFKDDLDYSEFTNISIEQFPLTKQEELIIKWNNLGLADDQISVRDYSSIDKLEEKINNVISLNHIVPRYPFYILSILQSLEVFMPNDMDITAYGHCYQALITAQIIKKGIKNDQIDTAFNYLREFAFSIFCNKKNTGKFGSSEYNDFIKNYKGKYPISDLLITRLENESYPIIKKRSEGFGFTQTYFYYYFLGMYLSKKKNQEIINDLVENIHLKENALILVFTIHHTQDKELLELILLHCLCSFDNIKPAELSTAETKFMNELIIELPASIVSNKTAEENRKEINRQNDNSEGKNEDVDDVSLKDLNKGLKIIEVLGQILKNRAGSFEIKEVQEILQYTIDLGLRILNIFLGTLNKNEFKLWLAKMLEDAEKDNISEHNYEMDYEKKIYFIEKTIQIFGYVVTIGMVNKISSSISSEKIISELNSISEKNNTPAYKLISYLVELFQTGINFTDFEKLVFEFDTTKNYWAKRSLSYYVQNYLNTHKVPFQERQKIFSALGIKKYKPNKIG
jgi:TIR domain